jgi:hypothetical protein
MDYNKNSPGDSILTIKGDFLECPLKLASIELGHGEIYSVCSITFKHTHTQLSFEHICRPYNQRPSVFVSSTLEKSFEFAKVVGSFKLHQRFFFCRVKQK